MKSLISFIFLFSLLNMTGQTVNQGRTGQIYSYDPVLSNNYKFQSDGELVSGSRFLFRTWNNRGLMYFNNKTYRVNNINLDIIRNEVVSLIGVDSLLVYEKSKIDSLYIGNKKFKKYTHDILYEVLFEDTNLCLLKRYKIIVREGFFNVMKGEKEEDYFVITTEYYQKKDSDLNRVHLNKKLVLSLFNNNQDKIKKFVNKNNLSYKNDADLVRILKYYEEL